jgi:hypothetical protein
MDATPYPGLRLGLQQQLGLRQFQGQYEAAREAVSLLAERAEGDLDQADAARVKSKLDRVEELLVEAAVEGGLSVPELSQ